MAIRDNDRTYVMGYWPVLGNAKNSLKHYAKYLPLTLEMISGGKLYFYSGNKSVINSVEDLTQKLRIALYVDYQEIDALPKFQHMQTLLQCAKEFGKDFIRPPAKFKREKGLIHYWRDLRMAGEDSFKRVFAIWHSKIDLLDRASTLNPFGSNEFAWIDASISRFNQTRAGWDFRRLDRIQTNTISHYPSDMNRNGLALSLNASFLLGDRAAIEQLKKDYDEAFLEALKEAFPNDEETVLDGLVRIKHGFFIPISGAAEKDLAALHQAPASSSQRHMDEETVVKSKDQIASPETRKVLVVGTFRSGTNAMKACLERHFDVKVTFNEWFWKHGAPPTALARPVPPDVPVIVMSKSPFSFHESLYRFWLHRRPELDAGRDISEFTRKELIVYDNTGGNVRPQYWFRCPTDYWNHFYFAWLNWREVHSRRLFVRYEDLAADTDSAVLSIAEIIGLVRKSAEPISLPRDRVGPHVPTEAPGEHYKLSVSDKNWIRERLNSKVLDGLGYGQEELI